MNYKRNKALFFSSTASSNSDRCIAPYQIAVQICLRCNFSLEFFSQQFLCRSTSVQTLKSRKRNLHISATTMVILIFFFFFQWKVPSTWDYMWKTNHKEYSNTVCALFFFFISNAFNLLTFKFNFSQLTYCQSRYTLVISPSNQIITFCLVKKKLNV